MHALTHRCYSAGARFVINRIIAPCLAPAPFHTFPDRRSSLGHGYKLVKSQTPLTTTVSQPSTASGLPGIPFPSTRSCACSTVEMSEGSVPMRALGSAGMTVQAQGLGAMGLTRWFYSYHSKDDTSTEEDSFATVARAVEMAAPNPLFVDTADFYGPFTNEEFVGKCIAKHGRSAFTVATKCGFKKTDAGVSVDGSRGHVRAACEASLNRLGVECIDLFYLHRVDRSLPIEETFEEFKALVSEGKIRYAGICECTADELRRANSVLPITALQLEWSLWTREHEADVIPVARELGIGIVAYSPLGRGMLTGTLKDGSSMRPDDMRMKVVPRFQGENLEKNLKLVEALEAEASAIGVTTSQLALAWVHSRGDDVFPIPGTKRIKYLEQNIAAVAVAKSLSPELLQRLELLFRPGLISGDRYDAASACLAKNGGLEQGLE